MAVKLLRWITLALPAGLIAEFLLGDQYLGGVPAPVSQQVVDVLLYTVFYGSAAITIREVTRRLGRGWPTILLLGLAWGVIEEGLVTQSLFDPHYLGAHLLQQGFIPLLGTSGPWLVFVLMLHMVWSVATPIALAEAIATPADGGPQRPWFGRFGLVLFPVLTALAAVAVFFASVPGVRGYDPDPLRLLGSVVAVVVLVVVAVLLPEPDAARDSGRVVLGIVLSAVLLSAAQLARGIGDPWLAVGVTLLALAALAVLVGVLRPAPVGLAAGAVLTYVWVGMRNAIPAGPVAIAEQSVLILLALAFTALALVRRRRGSVH